MFYQKQKFAGLSQKSFTLMLHVLFYAFYWRRSSKQLEQLEPLHLLKVHPKLIFRGTLKKTGIVPEDRSYQTQYFAKTFPSPLALMLQIHFYLYF